MAFSKDTYLSIFISLTGLISLAHSWNVSATASEAIRGQDATVKCSFIDIDNTITLNSLTISSPKNKYVSHLLPSNGIFINATNVNSRYSYDLTTHTLAIKDINCSDEKNFKCSLSVFINGGGQLTQSSEAFLTVKVRPIAPDPMTTVPANLTGGVNEGSSVSATCNANIGRPGRGKIRWRIYRNNIETPLEDNDSRIVTSQTSPNAGEDPCTQRYISTLTIKSLNESDQNMVLTCFVFNEDFPSTPAVCESSLNNLCQQSETIRVHYKVRNIDVSREPQLDIVEGESVTLRCTASGFPLPKYEWSKVGDNRTFTAEKDGSFSKLVLTNVDKDNDSGNYNCTAMNVFKGVTHAVSAQVYVNIVERPPTMTPDPVRTTDGGQPTGRPVKKSGSGDDDTVVIIVVVVVVIAVVIATVVVVCIVRKKRQSKEDPPRPTKEAPFYNNKETLGSPPDVLGDSKKKQMSGSLNDSFDMKNEDGLMYADLTYDNRPRSRKPMAIGDTSSDYSDVQMPQV